MARNKPKALMTSSDPLWYKDAIIYEVHVRAFCDSNADGIGDFRGLVTKLDYLQDVGVTALWLLPFYPSPLRDDGYDIADYTNINPMYGNLADFRLLLREAHRRGLRVITELVVNHTSDQHPWFQRARQAPPGSIERDFYVWSDTADKYKEARIIFSDFESSNWTWDPVARTYYWHRFYAHQPDLNYENPAVHDAVMAALDFWLALGIDGFRLDAVPYLYEREGTNCENLPETHLFLKELRRHVDERFKNRMLLAEANQWPEDAVAYFGQGDECHMSFHFPVMPRLFMAIQMEDRFPIIDILQQTPPIPPTNQWALFLRNHDELTLEMVTDEDRDYMVRVYAQDSHARINLGIRRRLAPLLENHRGKIELMNGLLFSLPGTPVIYYGDEIGMGDNIYLGDRNGVRTPMQWNPERNAGFSCANPQRLYLPVIIDPEYHYQAVNVETQQNNPHSLLWWMKRIIALRKRDQAFGRGTLEFLYPKNHKVLAFLRRLPASDDAAGDETILVVANLSRFVQYVELDLAQFKGRVPVEALGRTALPPIGDRPYLLTLGPYTFYWLALGPRPPGEAGNAMAGGLPALEVTSKWTEVLGAESREGLEQILLEYLHGQPWFLGKGRQAQSARITETIPISWYGALAFLTLIQIESADGEPGTCVVPLAFASGSKVEQIQSALPRSVICRLHVRGGETPDGVDSGILYDPVGEKSFSKALLEAFGRRKRFRGTRGELLALYTPALARLQTSSEPLPDPASVRAAKGSTAVIYGDRFYLKVFRWVEEGIHPEIEIGRALAERTSFSHVAPVAGSLEYRCAARPPVTLAALLGYVPNEGDAWRYTRDALQRFFVDVLTRHAHEKKPLLPGPPFIAAVAEELPPLVSEVIGPYLETARLIGKRTAEMHVALASITSDPAFAPEPKTALYQRSIYQTVRSEVIRVLELLREQMKELSGETRDKAQQLVARETEFHQALRRVLERKIAAQRIRGHGDYRLGSLLYTGRDFVIVNFEGETMLPLSNRRHKRSPLRDLASLFYSWYFAVRTTLKKGDLRPEDLPVLEPWTRFWHAWVSVVFMKSYLDIAGPASFLPKNSDDMQVTLDFYLLGRGVFELRYLLLNEPAMAEIPLRALLHLLDLIATRTTGAEASHPPAQAPEPQKT